MVHLQKFHEEYKDKGLVLLGFNCVDGRPVALDAMRQFGVTYPMILDTSDAAQQVPVKDYRGGALPLSYIIDREGKIVDAWFNYEPGHHRTKAALEKAGIQ
jgi:peroxiredoxin